ncbi:MAG: MogA/MoaB family molybdenum cofactor biosynthesis protein [Thaumarchaeota archaeon]|nr:MAG: MogA/MoaB family molybdenum cofactor biosynthesis protein [Nitrososphaerota archaeon]
MFKPEHRLPVEDIKFTIITISSSRFSALLKGQDISDESGNLAVRLLTDLGCKFNTRYLVPNIPSMIKETVLTSIKRDKSDLVITIGGTGISGRDITVDTLLPLMEKRLTSFDFLFFLLSYMQIGPDILLSRACAGVIKNSLIVCLPGSKKAVKLAIERIIGPELSHIIYHLREAKRRF